MAWWFNCVTYYTHDSYIFELIVSPFNVMGLYSEILFYILVGVGTGFLVDMEKNKERS